MKWVNPEVTYELRAVVLNANKKKRLGDEIALHLAAYDGESVLGIASFFPQNQSEEFQHGHWRIRGMAVQPDLQGSGIGKKIVDYFIEQKKEDIEGK